MRRAGLFRHKVTIKQSTETVGSMGGVTQAWATYATRMAILEPIISNYNGKENFVAQQFSSELTSKITLRFDTVTNAITSKMRVYYGSRIYEIVSPPINVGELNREISLLCREFK